MKPHYTNTNNPVDFPKSENKMNERIEELAKQANIWKPIHNHKTWVPGEYIASPGELEKFAELIVRECIEQCEKQEYEYWRAPEDQEFTPQDCADAIARHFGVEE
jgi:hypothetical protein